MVLPVWMRKQMPKTPNIYQLNFLQVDEKSVFTTQELSAAVAVCPHCGFIRWKNRKHLNE